MEKDKHGLQTTNLTNFGLTNSLKHGKHFVTTLRTLANNVREISTNQVIAKMSCNACHLMFVPFL